RPAGQAAPRQIRRDGRLQRQLMAALIEVRFKGNRRGAYRWALDAPLPTRDDPVLVEAERGLELGFVHAVGAAMETACGGCTSCGPTTPDPGSADAETARPRVVRLATTAD